MPGIEATTQFQGLAMSEQNTEIENGKALLASRRIAIHEAGHAVIAWAMGVKVHKIELADGDEVLIDPNGSPRPDVAAWVINSTGIDPQADFWPPKNNVDRFAYKLYKSRIEQELPVKFAGVVAESIYTGESVEALLEKGGRQDAEHISSHLSILRRMGADDADILSVRHAALEKAVHLVNHYQWEITGIAMILAKWEILWADEFYNYMELFTKQNLRAAV